MIKFSGPDVTSNTEVIKIQVLCDIFYVTTQTALIYLRIIKEFLFTSILKFLFFLASVKNAIEPLSSEVSEVHLKPSQTPKMACFASS